MEHWGIRTRATALLVLAVFALVVAVPATAMAASTFVGGADQWPAYVLNDHTPVAVHFTAGPGSGLAANTTYYVKVRYTVGTAPAGLTNRGYTWTATTQRWAQERDLWTTFPTASTDSAGAISDWVSVKFGDDTKSGAYHLMISLSTGASGSTFNSSIVPTVTVLDPRVSGGWVHNGTATGQEAGALAVATDAASSTALSTGRTEANGVDDDTNYIVDDEDWGPAGAKGDFHLGVPSVTPIGVTIGGVTWAPSSGFLSGAPDTDLAIGASDTSPPSAPPTVTVESADASVSLKWGVATDDQAIGGYYVYRWLPVVPGASYSAVHSRIATVQPDETSYVDTDVVNGNEYFYEVRAFDAATNVGPRSTTVTATPLSTLPRATITPAAPDGDRGWYLHPPTVELKTGGGRAIRYSLEASPSVWTTYTVPFVVEAEETTVTYQDFDGETFSATQTYGPIKVDTSTPTAVASAPLMSVATSKNRTFTLSWSGNDIGSGIDSYDVEYKPSPTSPWLPFRDGTTSTSQAYTADPGANVYFRVRATDLAGNIGPWSVPVLTLVPFDDTKAKFFSGWKRATNPSYYLGSARVSAKTGGYATLAFTKGKLYLVTKTGSKLGKIAVYFRGKKVATVNLHSATTKYRQTFMILSRSTGTKAYAVKLVNLGVSGHKQVEIDGFVLQR